MKVTVLSGKPIELGQSGSADAVPAAAPRRHICPCCQKPMALRGKIAAMFALPKAVAARGPPVVNSA